MSNLTRNECELFIYKIGAICAKNFLLKIASARIGSVNFYEFPYKENKALLEIDQESARLIVGRVPIDEINLLPLEIPDNIGIDVETNDLIWSCFVKNRLKFFLRIVNSDEKYPTATFYVEEE